MRGLRMTPGLTTGTLADHPRACGVYKMSTLRPIPLLGSSPRVRGLLHDHQGALDEGGIIPARAGFTRSAYFCSCGLEDHPRACGVYHEVGVVEVSGEGSSPRVRGLRV